MRRISCADTAKKCARFCHSHAARIHQPEEGFVDERRGLQRVAGALARHVAMGQPVQLVVDQRHQLRARASSSPAFQASNKSVICGDGSSMSRGNVATKKFQRGDGFDPETPPYPVTP